MWSSGAGRCLNECMHFQYMILGTQYGKYEILHRKKHIDVSIGVWVYGYIDTLIHRDTLIGAPIHRYAGCVYSCMDRQIGQVQIDSWTDCMRLIYSDTVSFLCGLIYHLSYALYFCTISNDMHFLRLGFCLVIPSSHWNLSQMQHSLLWIHVSIMYLSVPSLQLHEKRITFFHASF